MHPLGAAIALRDLEELDELLGNGALGFGLTSRKDEEESNEAQANGEE